MIDMHVHILPGVDDGSRDGAMTRDMMKRAVDAGVTRMICTPHVYRLEDQARNRGPLLAVREIAHEYGIPLSMGCEFNYRAVLRADMRALEDYCLGPTRCVLLEFSCEQPMADWEGVVCEMRDNGYMPIIAHPERYVYVQRDFGFAREMCDLGCELQLDAGGLMAMPLSAERRTARKLLKEGMASYVASDAHRPEDYNMFARACRTFSGEWPRDNRLTAAFQALKEERKKNG